MIPLVHLNCLVKCPLPFLAWSIPIPHNLRGIVSSGILIFLCIPHPEYLESNLQTNCRFRNDLIMRSCVSGSGLPLIDTEQQQVSHGEQFNVKGIVDLFMICN